jgi:hypothetical protein
MLLITVRHNCTQKSEKGEQTAQNFKIKFKQTKQTTKQTNLGLLMLQTEQAQP